MIKDSKVGWYSVEKGLTAEALQSYTKYPDLKKIPHIPTSLMNLQVLIEDDNSDSSKIARALRETPVLAAEVLRVSNLYTQDPSMKITSLEHAAGYLGSNTLGKLLVVAFVGLLDPTAKNFDRKRFWAESYLIGTITEMLGSKISSEYPRDILYIAGALANIGKLVLATFVPEEYDRLYEAYSKAPIGSLWVNVEKELGAPAHTLVGEIAGVVWGLDKPILESIQNHHHSPKLSEITAVHEIVAAANQMSHWVNLNPDMMDEDLLYKHTKKLALSNQDLEEFIAMIVPLSKELEEKLAS
ncbi:HDOD domain-containing protein [bacterium]|nr:HDOD domain-containing protein [bacterium]